MPRLQMQGRAERERDSAKPQGMGAAIREMTIDGVPASKVFQPQSIEELAQMVSAERGAIAPLGACTQMEFGNPLRRLDCAVDLTRLSRITEYNPADLTIHVEAGLTLEQLHHALLENNQFLPLDPWNGPTATI